MSITGTLEYTFTYTGTSGQDISTILPIVNTGGSFTTITPTFLPSATPATNDVVTVQIVFSYTDNTSTVDGFKPTSRRLSEGSCYKIQ